MSNRDVIGHYRDPPLLQLALLQLALAVVGVVALLPYPLALIWPSGWAWESGPPYQSHLFMMIVGIYATLGVFQLNAARNPAANLSPIWFTVVSSVVHAAIMAVQSFSDDHIGHLWEMSRRCFWWPLSCRCSCCPPASSSPLLRRVLHADRLGRRFRRTAAPMGPPVSKTMG
jgi:hypothetical protein